MDKFKVEDIHYEFTREIEDEQEAEIEFVIKFSPLIQDRQNLEPSLEFVGFSTSEMGSRVFSAGYEFSDDDDIEPSSVYFQSVHNPVDLKWLRIEKQEAFELIEFELFFDFEYENTDYGSQSLRLTHKKYNG